MTTDTRNAKGWPKVFADGRGVGERAASIYTGARTARHLRGLYATSSTRPPDLLPAPGLRDAAALARGGRGVGRDRRRGAAAGRRVVHPIDGHHEARWALQAQRDLDGELPALAAPVQAMYEAEVAALARLQQAGA